MSRQISFFILLLLSYKGTSQTLNISDLESLFFISPDKYDTYLYEKGYELHKVKKDDYQVQTVTFKYSPKNKEPEYMAKHIFTDGSKLLTYNMYNTKDFVSFKNTFEKYGYSYIEQKHEDNRLITEYKRNSFYLIIYTTRVNNYNESYVAYEINLTSKKP